MSQPHHGTSCRPLLLIAWRCRLPYISLGILCRASISSRAPRRASILPHRAPRRASMSPHRVPLRSSPHASV
eukprot:9503204-Pyramimonas_sp.AAC.1